MSRSAALTACEAHLEAAMAHHRAGRLAAAMAAYRAVLEEAPEHPDALHLLGVALHQSGRPRAGLAQIARVLAQDPAFPQALANAALILQALGQPGEGAAYAQAALILHPAYAEAWTNLGNIQKDRNRLAEADTCHRWALAIRPSYGEAMTNWGAVQELRGEPEAAAALHRAALVLRPDLADAHNNLGIALQALGKREEAAVSFARALALQADLALAQWNLGLLRLAAGKLVPGWQGYRWRFRGPQMLKARHFPFPEWQGESLAGRRLLVWREQGVGDEVLFSTLWPDLLTRATAEGGTVILETEPRLVSLFQRRFPTATVRPAPDPASGPALQPEPGDPHARTALPDIHIPAGSLPALLRPALDRFPPRPEGLIPCPDRAALWHRRLAALPPGLRIGLCWRSRDLAARRRRSYTSLRDWQPLLTRPGVQIICLQYDDCTAEIADAEARFGVSVHQWADLNLKDDFEGVAALMVNLDLVITGPTSVGELAAALGVPVWRLAWYGDWSALGTMVRPWYPSMRLFTGLADGALPETLAALLSALDTLERRAVRRRLPPAVPDEAGASASGADRRAGLAALAAGQPGLAAEALARAAVQAPQDPEIRNAWGVALQRLGQTAAALTHYQAALALAPMAADSRVNLAALAVERGELAAAEACLRQAVALDPALDAAFGNLGLVLSRQGALADAETAYRCALRLHPQNAAAQAPLRLGLAAVWRQQARFQDAAAVLEPVLRAALPPLTVAEAWSDLALIRQRQGRFRAAEQALGEALTLAPELASAHLLRSQLRLQRGDLAGGWADAVWRFAADRRAVLSPAAFRLPEWQGETLAGRHLLVWREQGVGDELLLATLYPDLLARVAAEGGTLTLTCDPRLVSLFHRSFPAAAVQPQDSGTWPAGVDCQIAAGSLGRLLRPSLAAFPAPALADAAGGGAVLRADPVRQAVWAERLAALDRDNGQPRLRIGLAWRSGLLNPERSASYTGLKQWQPLLCRPGIQVIPLQYQADPREIAAVEAEYGCRLPGWPDLDLKDDFENVAALMTHLDLMLCGPTAAGELAAALGVPVWRLSWRGDWTTLGSRQRPWFPSLRPFLAGDGETLDDQIAAVVRRLAVLEQRSVIRENGSPFRGRLHRFDN